jgi:hypothetical protein
MTALPLPVRSSERSWAIPLTAAVFAAFLLPSLALASADAGLAPRERPEVVIKTVLALLALVALAWLGGHAKVQQWEAKLRVSQVITAGFPFVLLGLAARHPAVGVVTEPVLAEMNTVLGVALGWLGLVAGFRFDARLVSGLPPGTARSRSAP